MIRRPPRSTPLSLHDALPISHQGKRMIEPVVFLLSRSRCACCASARSEEHTSELQSRPHLVCRLLLEKKKKVTRAGGAVRLARAAHRPRRASDQEMFFRFADR